MMKKTVLLVAILLLAGTVTAQDSITQPTYLRTFSSTLTRGFFIQCPQEFFVTGLRAPDESNLLKQYVALMRSTIAPPAFSATVPLTTTTGFKDIFGKSSSLIIPCKVKFTKGEWLVAFGACSSNGSTMANSYGTPAGCFTGDLLGTPVSVCRCGIQASIATATEPFAVWSEITGNVGRVEVYVSDVYLIGNKLAPKPGESVVFGIEGITAFASQSYYMASSLGKGPFTILGRNVWLNADALFQLSLGGTLPGIFANYSNLLDANAKGKAALNIPALNALIGFGIYTCCSVWDKSGKPVGFSNPFFFKIS